MKPCKVWQFLCLSAITVAVAAGCGPMSDLVKGDDCNMNGSFEVTKGGLPVNWYYYSPNTVSNADFEIVTDSTTAVDGKNSLKFMILKCDSIGGLRSPGFFSSYKVQPGEIYKVSLWAINDGCKFIVDVGTGMKGVPGISGTVVNTRKSFNEWKYFEHLIEIPSNNSNIRIEVNILTPGTIWFDDIRITGMNDTTIRTMYPFVGFEECE